MASSSNFDTGYFDKIFPFVTKQDVFQISKPTCIEREDINRARKTWKLQSTKDMSFSQDFCPTIVSTSSITVPGNHAIWHISCVTSDRLWVSDSEHLLLVDTSGHKIQKKKIEIGKLAYAGIHSVTEEGDLLFIDDNKVQKMTSDGTITTLIHQPWESLFCIHSSRLNGDILLGCFNEVRRFDRMGRRAKIWRNETCYYPKYITENKNGDIWFSNWHMRVVVAMDKSGKQRFKYRGQQNQYDFCPRGICADVLGQILVCDNACGNQSVHLLDQKSQFLGLLLTEKQGLYSPLALCVDDKHKLYMGQMFSNTIMVYKYVQETDVSVSPHLNSALVITSSFIISRVNGLFHISCMPSDRFWVNDDRLLLQVDSSGCEQKRKKATFCSEGGVHTVTEDGDLLFIDHTKVQKMTADGIITTLIKPDIGELYCVHSSRINGDILLGCHYGLMRYDKWGKLSADVRMNRTFQIYYPMYITENKNGDIWVSELLEEAVMVFDKSGQYRLKYTGQQTWCDYNSKGFSNFLYQYERPSPFGPRGICTDILGQVLVSDILVPSVHLLDQDGKFLRLLLTREHGLYNPTALCLDNKHNLYVGEKFSNKITVYKYL
ncbi:uncharacterized protein LOC133179768 [Saccostrea echinata]|uniref:uncharacterized protein LOC133179768 n=1 Tax=Saccostrea echinata TaxID=191078 RepID=UPI002A81A31F|nr:uncharacterized protein LOC133179768 [Saccostrea echinata]